MEISTAKTPLSEQISGLHISTNKFKTARISLSFILPLDQKTAAYSALLAKILCRSNQKYPTPSLLKSRLNYLYGAAIHSLTLRLGDNQLLSFSITSLCNRYALSGEKISKMSSDLLRAVVFEPNLDGTAFKAEDFEVEKRLVIEEIESLINDKRRYAVTNMLEAMCENEPFGTVNDVETVNAITREELFAFWQNMLKTAPVVVIVTGEEDPQPVYEVFKLSLIHI